MYTYSIFVALNYRNITLINKRFISLIRKVSPSIILTVLGMELGYPLLAIRCKESNQEY